MAKPPLALVPGQLELVRPPAPGNLELVRRFINTLDVEKGTDALATPEGLAAWLREYRLIDRKTKVELAEVGRVQAIRETLRALARRNNGIPVDCETALLKEASERGRLALDFDTGGTLRAKASGVDGALGTILAGVHTAMLEGDWPRLKACADDSCAWIYFDHSKNGCSRWCSAETCGNRSKVKRYRERQAQVIAE